MKPHAHPAALTALLALAPLPESEVARRAPMHPSQLGHLKAGDKPGTREETRRAVADALGVDVLAVTCFCDRPDKRCRAASGGGL